jgi:hypothetical protein
MNSSDPNSHDEPETDPRLRESLRALPTLETPPTLESRVRQRIRWRRTRRAVLACGSVLAVAGALLIWQVSQPRGAAPAPGVPHPQPVPQIVQAPPAPVGEIPADELAVLFAPPPVDHLTIVGKRNEGWVAALNRLEDKK